MLICLRISQRFSLRLRSRLCLLWGGVMRVPCHGAVYPISPYSDMTARLQQSSILDWAQSQHQSAASGTGVDVATRSHCHPNGQSPPLRNNVWVFSKCLIRVLVEVLVPISVRVHAPSLAACLADSRIAVRGGDPIFGACSCSPSVLVH